MPSIPSPKALPLPATCMPAGHACLPTNHPDDPRTRWQKSPEQKTKMPPMLCLTTLDVEGKRQETVRTHKKKALVPRTPPKVPPKKVRGLCPLVAASGNRSQNVRKRPPILATGQNDPTDLERRCRQPLPHQPPTTPSTDPPPESATSGAQQRTTERGLAKSAARTTS